MIQPFPTCIYLPNASRPLPRVVQISDKIYKKQKNKKKMLLQMLCNRLNEENPTDL
jgi:hypothetical protein